MNSSNKMHPPKFVSMQIDGFAPSWAGPHPFEDGFAFGSEDGMVAFTDEAGKTTQETRIMAASREAINGIAGMDNFLAVTTRQEVTVFALQVHEGEKTEVTTFRRGAHGILASSGNQFIAPLGHGGVMIAKPSEGLVESMRVYPLGDGNLNVYEVHEMPSHGTHDAFIAACRSNGVGLILSSTEKQELAFETCNLGGIDVVDVVPVGTAAHPHAVVAAGMDGEVVLFRDIVSHERPILLKYDEFAGKTYRILSSHGHLFVLTSKAVYVLGNLANRVSDRILGEHGAPVMTIPMEAIDANMCGTRWLLAVMPDEVRRYDVQQIHDMITEFTTNDTGAATSLPHSQLNFAPWQIAKSHPLPLQTVAS